MRNNESGGIFEADRRRNRTFVETVVIIQLKGIAVQINGSSTLATSSECFGEHQLPHPVNALISGLHGKVMRLGTLSKDVLAVAAPIGRRDQRESKSGFALGVILTLQDCLLESGGQLGTGGER
jgi:hypothetical protein